MLACTSRATANVICSIWAPLIVTFILSFPDKAVAEFDFSMESLARSYPLAGFVSAQLGYGLVVWGDHKPGDKNIDYGYARLFAEGGTAGTYNSGLVGGEVYPISFLGFKAGKEWIQNDDDYRDFDCVNFNCKGARSREFYQARLLFGAWFLFSSFSMRVEKWHEPLPYLGDFIEPTSGLSARADGDTQTVYSGLIGANLTDTWSIVAAEQYFEMSNNHGITRTFLGGPRWSDGEFSVLGGLTYFESSASYTKEAFGVLVLLNWVPLHGVALD